jgi:hypothetical protein
MYKLDGLTENKEEAIISSPKHEEIYLIDSQTSVYYAKELVNILNHKEGPKKDTELQHILSFIDYQITLKD